jgi:lysophospholipase L1-like esterase
LVTDSLALPRDKPEQVVFEDCYPQLLKTEFKDWEIQQLSIGGATISELVSAAKYYKSFNPNVVIIQSGIVDCAPRALSKLDRLLWRRIPLVGKWILNAATRNALTLRKIRKISYTKPRDFDKWLNRFNILFKDASKIHIAIMPGSEDYEEKLPGVCSNISRYNEIIGKNASFIVANNARIEWLMSDHHHLNKQGHKAIANELIDQIKRFSS